MSVTRATVIAVAPELADIPAEDGRWAAFIADADLFASVNVLGQTRGDAAKKYLVAHWMTCSVAAEAEAEEEHGPLKSVTIGPVTKTYATATAVEAGVPTHDDLTSTSYGSMFNRLIRVASIGVF